MGRGGGVTNASHEDAQNVTRCRTSGAAEHQDHSCVHLESMRPTAEIIMMEAECICI